MGLSEAPVRAQLLGAADAQHIQQALNQGFQQVEEPQAEGDVQVDQVGEADDGEAEAEDQVHSVAEQGQAGDQLGRGQEVVVRVQGFETADYGRQGKAGPHHRVAEEGRHAMPLFLPHHLQGHLGHRVEQALVLHPLPPQDHRRADHGGVQGQKKESPVEQGVSPGHPGDRVALGCPLEEPLDELGVLRGHPGGDMGVDEVFPVVLGGGEVVDRGDQGQEIGHQPHAGDG